MAWGVRIESGTLKYVSPKVRDTGSVVRQILIGKIRDTGNVLRTFYTTVQVEIAPVSFELYRDVAPSAFPYLITTPICQAIVTGGIAPYTYSWARISGHSDITANDPLVASTPFHAYFNAQGSKAATFGVTVTDANGAVAIGKTGQPRATVDISFEVWEL